MCIRDRPQAQRQSGAGVPVARGGAAGDDGGLAAGGQSGQESARRADGTADGGVGADAPRGGGNHGGESGVEKNSRAARKSPFELANEARSVSASYAPAIAVATMLCR